MTAMLCTTSLLFAAGLAAQEPDRLLSGVPEDALAVVAVDGLDAIRARAAGNDWWKLLEGEELRPFVTRAGELLTEAFDDAMAEESEQLRKIADPRTWVSSIHGPAVGFLVLDGDQLGGLGLFIEPGEDSEAFDELRAVVLEEARSDARESSQEYQGVELTILESDDSDDDEPTLGIFFEVAGVHGFVMGEERPFVLELAQGGIDRMLGKDPSPGFAGAAVLVEARRAGGEQRSLELLVDVAGFVRFGLAEEAREREVDPQGASSAEKAALTVRILERIGLSAMRHAYVSADIGEGERLDLAFSLHLPPGSLLQKSLSYLQPAPRKLFALAPADSVSASVGAIDLAGLWHWIRDVIAEFDAHAREQVDAGIAAFEAMVGLDLEEDLLEVVSGELLSATVPIPPDEVPPSVTALMGEEGKELVTSMGVYAMRVEDGSSIEDFIARLLRTFQLSGMVEEQEYQGHTVQFLGSEGEGVYWSCTDEYFVLSQTPTPLRAVLVRIGGSELPSVTADARYRAVLEGSVDAAVLGVSDATALVETFMKGVAFGISMVVAQEPESAGGRATLELLELLPEPSFVGKYIDGVIHNALEVRPESLVLRMGAR